MKRVLSVQDLSCMGKCSLTVALPVLSAMGCGCTVLPTAVLSTHTGFPSPYRRSLTEDIGEICCHWQSVGARFDGIGVGYLATPEQAEAVMAVLDAFQCLTVIDPAMADHGKLYSGLTPEQIPAAAALCRRGQVLLPNVTEAALLTHLPYREAADMGYYRDLVAGMMEFGPEAVIITGAAVSSGQLGFVGAHRQTGEFSYQAPLLHKKHHGTGDLFAAVVLGGLMAGQDIAATGSLAARFVERVLSDTLEKSSFGVEFETQLPWLWEQLQKTGV